MGKKCLLACLVVAGLSASCQQLAPYAKARSADDGALDLREDGPSINPTDQGRTADADLPLPLAEGGIADAGHAMDGDLPLSVADGSAFDLAQDGLGDCTLWDGWSCTGSRETATAVDGQGDTIACDSTQCTCYPNTGGDAVDCIYIPSPSVCCAAQAAFLDGCCS